MLYVTREQCLCGGTLLRLAGTEQLIAVVGHPPPPVEGAATSGLETLAMSSEGLVAAHLSGAYNLG